MTAPTPQEPEQKESRAKKATAGGWDWLKGKHADKALLATIATAVVGGLAVAGIVIPQRDLERRMGVTESRLDGVLDRLGTIDGALSAIQSADPVGAVATLAPQVKDLAGQVGSIRDRLGAPTPTTTAAATTGVTTSTTVVSVGPDTTVVSHLTAAETKLNRLASDLAAEQETSKSLSTAVASVRTDLAAARSAVTAAQAAADQAKTAAAHAQGDVDALTSQVTDLQALVSTLEAKQRTVKFGESGVAGPNNGVFATLSTVTVGRGRAFARWEWFHAPANGNCIAQVQLIDANGQPAAGLTTTGDSHPSASVYALHATWDAGAGGTFRLQTAVSGSVICTSNRVFAETEATG